MNFYDIYFKPARLFADRPAPEWQLYQRNVIEEMALRISEELAADNEILVELRKSQARIHG